MLIFNSWRYILCVYRNILGLSIEELQKAERTCRQVERQRTFKCFEPTNEMRGRRLISEVRQKHWLRFLEQEKRLRP